MSRRLINPGPSTAGWHLNANWLTCPRKGAILEQGYTPDLRDPLVRGELLHVGLAHFYGRQIYDDLLSPEAAVDELAALRNEQQPSYLWEVWSERVKEILPLYVLRADDDWRVLDVEKELLVEIQPADWNGSDPFLYTQRVDLIIQRRRKVWFVDHKGTSRSLKGYGKEYAMDGQFLGYRLLGNAHYENFGGVMVNAIQLTEKAFDRRTFTVPTPILNDIKHTLQYAWHTRHTFAGQEPADIPGTYTQCTGRWGLCPCWDYCMFGG